MDITHIRRTGASLIAMSVLWIGTADAQVRYYARERLPGLLSSQASGPPATTTPPAQDPVQYGAWSLSADYVASKSCGGVDPALPNVAEMKRAAVCSTSTCDPLTKPVEPVKRTGCSMTCSGSNAQVDTVATQISGSTIVRAASMPASATTPASRLAAAVSYCNGYVPDVNFRALGCYATTSQIVALLTSSSKLEYATRTLAGGYLMACTAD